MHEKKCDYQPGDKVTFPLDRGPRRGIKVDAVPATVIEVRYDYVRVKPDHTIPGEHWFPADDLTLVEKAKEGAQ